MNNDTIEDTSGVEQPSPLFGGGLSMYFLKPHFHFATPDLR